MYSICGNAGKLSSSGVSVVRDCRRYGARRATRRFHQHTTSAHFSPSRLVLTVLRIIGRDAVHGNRARRFAPARPTASFAWLCPEQGAQSAFCLQSKHLACCERGEISIFVPNSRARSSRPRCACSQRGIGFRSGRLPLARLAQNRTRHGRFGKDGWIALRQKQGSNVRAQGSVLPRFPSDAATPASIIAALEAAAGLRPGTRASFASGRCVRGT